MFCGAALCTKCRRKGSVFFWFVQEAGCFFCVGGGGISIRDVVSPAGEGAHVPRGVVWSDGDSGQ